MIYHVTGDILLTKAQAIAHGIAPNDDFNNGLAHSLREEWPAMYKDFRHYCHNHHPKSGGLWAWAGADGKRIVNLFTQEPAVSHHSHPGRASVENVNHALRELKKLVAHEHFSSLALPRLATGVGGLEWEEVNPLLEKYLADLNIPVFIYVTYHKGMQAEEAL